MLKPDIKIKKKSKAVIPLIIAAAAVWGIIVFRIIDYYSGAAEETQVIINDENLIPVVNDINESASRAYNPKPIKRDPFTKQKTNTRETIPAPEQRIVKIDNTPEPQPMIEYRITGTIINSGSRMVILEDITNNRTEFLREGDEYKNIKVMKINYDTVELRERGKDKTFDIK